MTYSGNDAFFDSVEVDSCADDNEGEWEYEAVFRAFHTLCAEYRSIFVDYYIGSMSVKSLSRKYSLPGTTIKWRLNSGREKSETE